MARPKDYREQDGCWNCKHVYEKEEYDEASEFFCTVDGIAQPSLSFDVYDVDTVSKRNNLMQKLLKSWYEWADPRQVKEYGICNLWIKREVNDEPPNSP